MRWLDPRLFNYIIMALYLLNAVRWLIAGKTADVCYWLSAFRYHRNRHLGVQALKGLIIISLASLAILGILMLIDEIS